MTPISLAPSEISSSSSTSWGLTNDLLIIAGDNLFTYRLRDAFEAFGATGRI
jgi:hypothetical protein